MRAIDADALKDVIQQHDYPLTDRINSIDNGMFTLGIFQAIDQMPTLSSDDVRGVGEWIAHGDCGVTECSVCGWNIEEYVEYNYCPSCGAKMKGE